jgi:uncharacterized delta-60 repeat protein
MKKTLLFLILILYGIRMDAQCWKSISTGTSHCLALREDGTIWGWARNDAFQLGSATSSITSNIPIQIGSDTDWSSICATLQTSYAIKTDGTLWGWGANPAYYGSLPLFVTIPTQLGTANNWKIISGNHQHQLAIKTDGTLWSWGPRSSGNQYGQLGNGTITPSDIPTQVGSASDWAMASAGTLYSLALKTDGTLWAWGLNDNGQLGAPPASPGTYYTPVKIGTDNDWIAISAGEGHSHAIKSDGSLWSWGLNDNGQLGDGTLVNKNSPIRIGMANDWKLVTGSGRSTFAIKNNGDLYAWGDNLVGTLGDGTNIDRLTPVHISPGTAWKNISGEFGFSLGLKQDNTLFATGTNDPSFPYLGNGTSINSKVFVAVTANCSLITSIIANNDSGTALNGLASTPITNVLTNDTFNGNPATFSNVTLSFTSSTHSGITLNTLTGAVNVSAAVPVGTYTLNYQICQTTSLSNCDNATVTITVNPQTIDAVNDNFSGTPIDYLTGGVTPSLLTNDIVNGAAANPADVILTLTNNGGVAGASINANGGINIPVGTLMNTYTLQYSICLISNPSICDTASVIVTVADRVITTPEIIFAIRANTTVFESQLQSTGKIIICGPFTKYNNVDARHLVRLNTDLTQDTTFPALGSLPHPPEDFKVLPNDKIIAVGTFTSINGTPTPRGIARLNANGTVDTSFNAGGTGIDSNSRIISCAVQSDGKILLGGGFIFSYNGATTRNMIRLNSDGTLDTSFVYPYTFNPNRFGSIHKIVLQPDGKILVTGNNSMSVDAFGNAIGQPHIFRLNSDGSLDTTFTTTFLESYFRDTNFCSTCINPIQNIVLQPDGKIIIVGVFVNFHDVRRKNNIVRLNSDGTLDTTFQTNKASTTSNRVIKDAVIEPSGKIIIGGEFTVYNGATANKLIRLNANGTVDATFSPGDGPTHANNYPGTVFDLNRQADGKVIVSGSFSHYNNISATNITRIAPEIPGSQARGNGIQLWNTEKEIGNNVQTTIGEISIYPNPSSGIFSVDLTQSKEPYTTIMVYNALGQKVYQTNSVPESVNEIDLSNLPDGYYYAQITGGKSSVQKVLIKK